SWSVLSVVTGQWSGKAPNPKHQTPNKSQTPNSKHRISRARRSLEFGNWSFFGIWALVIGTWSFFGVLNLVLGASLEFGAWFLDLSCVSRRRRKREFVCDCRNADLQLFF